MTNKVKLAFLMLLPIWGTLINLVIYTMSNHSASFEAKRKPLLMMTGLALVLYFVLTFGTGYLLTTVFKIENLNFLTILIAGYVVNIVHYLQYTVKYMK